jgi:hypothetical protein
MKTKTQKQTPEAVLQIDEQTQNAHLSSLRARLQHVKTSPCMGEIAPVLLQMLDAGQITCKQEHRYGTAEIMLAAKVTPAQIRELQSLVTHPATHGTFRYFLEGAIDIVTRETRRDTLVFSATEQFLPRPESDGPQGCLYERGGRSGVVGICRNARLFGKRARRSDRFSCSAHRG